VARGGREGVSPSVRIACEELPFLMKGKESKASRGMAVLSASLRWTRTEWCSSSELEMSSSKSRPRESLVRERWRELAAWRVFEGREMSLVDFSVMILCVEEFAFWAVLIVSGVGGKVRNRANRAF